MSKKVNTSFFNRSIELTDSPITYFEERVSSYSRLTVRLESPVTPFPDLNHTIAVDIWVSCGDKETDYVLLETVTITSLVKSAIRYYPHSFRRLRIDAQHLNDHESVPFFRFQVSCLQS